MISNLMDCSTSQEAWEKINEFLFLNEGKLQESGQGRVSNCIVSYNNMIFIRKAWVDPEFNFARIFGYRKQKWSSLVNNYVNIDYLDMIKSDIMLREKKKASTYNVTLHFSNHHDSGKDCLISLTFSRRIDSDIPILTFHVRASEVSKRLLWDFLLIQRMGEYVYGPKQSFSILLMAPMMFLSAEAFTMYHTHKDIYKLSKPIKDNPRPIQKKILECLDKFRKIDPLELNYKSHRRSVRQLQTDKNGIPLSGDVQLLVKHLHIKHQFTIDYPVDAFTEKARKEHRKKLRHSNSDKK